MTVICLGTSQDKDGEEGRQGHHREILHPAGKRLPHQQEGVWGDCHYSQQEAAQQDRWVSVLGEGRILEPCIESDHGLVVARSLIVQGEGNEGLSRVWRTISASQTLALSDMTFSEVLVSHWSPAERWTGAVVLLLVFCLTCWIVL